MGEHSRAEARGLQLASPRGLRTDTALCASAWPTYSYANGPCPLALHFFGRDGRTRDQVLQQTTSGNLIIHDTLFHYPVDDLPIGGVGASGIGAAKKGFKALSHARGRCVAGALRTNHRPGLG